MTLELKFLVSIAFALQFMEDIFLCVIYNNSDTSIRLLRHRIIIKLLSSHLEISNL